MGVKRRRNGKRQEGSQRERVDRMRFFRLGCILFATILLAQGPNSGAINGTVTDSSGAAIPGVKVTVTSPALQGQETSISNEQGSYRFPILPIGVYRVAYEASGFATVVREGINISIGFTAT